MSTGAQGKHSQQTRAADFAARCDEWSDPGSAGNAKSSPAIRNDYADATLTVVTHSGYERQVYELAGDSANTLSDYAVEMLQRHVATLAVASKPDQIRFDVRRIEVTFLKMALPQTTSASPAEQKLPRPTIMQLFKRVLAPLAVTGALLAKILAPALKFLPVIVKTGGTMLLTVGIYAMTWGVWFAVGFVALLLIHECGHLLAAKRVGLKVGAPVFIPFMGAFIALKEAPPNAWVEAQVGIGGPMLGSLGAALCEGVFLVTGIPIFRALAYTGFLPKPA